MSRQVLLLRSVLLPAGLALLLFACDERNEARKSRASASELDPNNPYAPLHAALEAGQEMKVRAARSGDQGPAPGASPSDLLSVFKAPGSFLVVGEPQLSTERFGDVEGARVTQKYERGEGTDRRTVKVTVLDGRKVSAAYSAFSVLRKLPRVEKSGRGSFDWKGFDAFETFEPENGDGRLLVLVADRFLVSVEGRGVALEELDAFLSVMNHEALITWAKAGTSAAPNSPPPKG